METEGGTHSEEKKGNGDKTDTSVLWNKMVLTLCILLLVFGGIFIFWTPEIFRDVVKNQGMQIIIITLVLPVITFLLATAKITPEAGLSLLGAIIGYAFGKVT